MWYNIFLGHVESSQHIVRFQMNFVAVQVPECKNGEKINLSGKNFFERQSPLIMQVIAMLFADETWNNYCCFFVMKTVFKVIKNCNLQIINMDLCLMIKRLK